MRRIWKISTMAMLAFRCRIELTGLERNGWNDIIDLTAYNRISASVVYIPIFLSMRPSIGDSRRDIQS